MNSAKSPDSGKPIFFNCIVKNEAVIINMINKLTIINYKH